MKQITGFNLYNEIWKVKIEGSYYTKLELMERIIKSRDTSETNLDELDALFILNQIERRLK